MCWSISALALERVYVGCETTGTARVHRKRSLPRPHPDRVFSPLPTTQRGDRAAVAGRRSLFAALALLATMLLVAGCGDGGKDKKAASGRFATIRAGTLTVGSDIPYPPFEFGRPPYEGFDVDVVNEVAKRLDLEARIQKGPFEAILRGLGQSRFDLVASAVPITSDRRKTVDFSEPYFPAEQSLMVKKGSSIRAVSDLNGKRVGRSSAPPEPSTPTRRPTPPCERTSRSTTP